MFYSDTQFGIHTGMSHTGETKQTVGSIGKRGMAPLLYPPQVPRVPYFWSLDA